MSSELPFCGCQSQRRDLYAEMVREPETHRDESERRIHRARRRVHRGPADVEIVEAVHATVGVDYPLLRVRTHPCRPHVVPAPTDEARPAAVVAQQPIADLYPTGTGAAHLA